MGGRKNEGISLRVEAKRAIRNFMNKIDCMCSRGELNSDGVKALTRIIRMLNNSGMRDEAKRLSKMLKRRDELENLLSLLYQLEERLS
ncbi:MAG: hypothetical protein QW706_04860 [Candidatus Nezhaarchaeales archaeon]